MSRINVPTLYINTYNLLNNIMKKLNGYQNGYGKLNGNENFYPFFLYPLFYISFFILYYIFFIFIHKSHYHIDRFYFLILFFIALEVHISIICNFCRSFKINYRNFILCSILYCSYTMFIILVTNLSYIELKNNDEF